MWEAYMYSGLCYHSLGQYDDALEQYNVAAVKFDK